MPPGCVATERRPDAAVRLILVASMALGIVFALGLLAGVDALNGTWYWRRPWQALPLPRSALLLGLALLPAWLALRWRGARPWQRLALLMLAALGLQWAAALCHPAPLERLAAIIQSPVATSYYTDALGIDGLRAWLGGFHAASLALHSATHPPGPILFHYFFASVFGPAAPLAAALAIGVLAACGVPLAWWFAGRWSTDAQARLWVAALHALMPALVVFFPEFDQIYPLLTMLAVLAWLAVLDGSRLAACWLGVLAFIASFLAWNFLVLGLFGLLSAAWRFKHTADRPRLARRIGAGAGTALAVCAGLYGLLWLATGHRPLASLQHAMATQAVLAGYLDRPWLACVLLDPWDFLVGTGVTFALLPVPYFRRARSDTSAPADAVALAWIGLATVLLVDVSGLLRAETMRVWLFLQPFVLVPAGLALARMSERQQAALLAIHGFVLVAMVSRISFIDP